MSRVTNAGVQFRQTTSLASTWKVQRKGPATTVQNPRPLPRSKSSPKKSCNRSSRTKKTIRRSLQHFDLPLQRWTLHTLTCKLLITGHYPVQKRGGNFFPLFAPLGFNSLGGESLPLQRKGGSPSRRDFRGEEEEKENQKVSGDRKGHFSFSFLSHFRPSPSSRLLPSAWRKFSCLLLPWPGGDRLRRLRCYFPPQTFRPFE